MTFTIRNTELSARDFHDIIAGARGPDAPQDRMLTSSHTRVDIIKSCTAVIVRRALYGRVHAAMISDPEFPLEEKFMALSYDEIIAAVGSHYCTHAVVALRALIDTGLMLGDDRDLAARVIEKLRT